MIRADNIADLKHLEAPLHLALGIFDGVHLGHRNVIQQALNASKQDNGVAAVLTFEPHPRQILAPDKAPKRLLASIDHKIQLLRSLSLDAIIIQKFDLNFASKTAENFIQELNNNSHNLASISVGEGWSFGKGRTGNIETLQTWGSKMGFTTHISPPVLYKNERISSTRIRQAIQQGNFLDANAMLGRDYTVIGTVVAGKKLARELGFPTANLIVHNEQLPPDGVWELNASIDGKTYHAIGNLGRRPTVEYDGARRMLEVHILDFNQDLYGKHIECTFLNYIREEKKFDSIEQLKQQIQQDVSSLL